MGKRPIKGVILGPEEGLSGWALAGMVVFGLLLLGQCSG